MFLGLLADGDMHLAVHCGFPQIWCVWRHTSLSPDVIRRHYNMNQFPPRSVTSFMDDPPSKKHTYHDRQP